MFKLPFFGKKKLLLAFEYSAVLHDSAHELGITITPEIIERAEILVLNEFKNKGKERLALEMIPNIMAILEPKENNLPVIEY